MTSTGVEPGTPWNGAPTAFQNPESVYVPDACQWLLIRFVNEVITP